MNAILTQETDEAHKEGGFSQIHDILLSIGMPPNLLGYSYVLYATELILSNPDYMHAITKELYVEVARKYNSTPSRVERAIRHAIGTTWLHGNLDYINQIFINCIRPDKGTPTNSLFLSRIYYYLLGSMKPRNLTA